MGGDEEEGADVASNENERAKWETTHIYMYENISTHSYHFKHHPLKTLTSCRVQRLSSLSQVMVVSTTLTPSSLSSPCLVKEVTMMVLIGGTALDDWRLKCTNLLVFSCLKCTELKTKFTTTKTIVNRTNALTVLHTYVHP